MKNFCAVLLSFGLSVLFVNQAKAQDDVGKVLIGGIQDGTKLVNGYVDPFMKVLGTGLGQGWYNTAKPHKVAGFDLTATVNAIVVPSSANYYNVNDLKLSTLELVPNQPGIVNGNVPTVFGPDITPTYRLKAAPSQQYTTVGGFDLKKSIGMNALPIPMVQLGFGLPKSFEIKVRFFPSTKVGDNGNFQLFGLGLMHDVKQYIPGIKMMPFDLSVFVGYTHMKLDYKLDPTNHPDQNGVFEVNTTTIQGVISKKIAVLTVYGGAGYNIAKSSLALLGKYDLDGDGTYGDKTKSEVDPINSKFSASGPRVTAGFRLKLAVFTLHADYTLQKYSSITAGFGISVR